jgi:hypothetical protein
MSAEDLYADWGEQLDYWAEKLTQALLGEDADTVWSEHPLLLEQVRRATAKCDIPRQPLRTVIEEVLVGLFVSALTAVDGGTKASDHGRLFLVDQDGKTVSDSLHDDFVLYLVEAGRI